MIEDFYDLIVIGGGAAGSMCALTAGENNLRVLLIEPNYHLGKKLRITGKGRCNITNNCSVKNVVDNITDHGRFLYSALSRFSPEDVMNFFESYGLKLKTERGNRVFPVSDNANDVANLLEKLCRGCGVQFCHEHAIAILSEDNQITAVKTEGHLFKTKSAAVCTGGKSYPLTGSTGDGYRLAKMFGHSIVTPKASLVPIECSSPYCAQLQGLALKNVTVSLYEDNKIIFSELGEMLFTHFGVSGPLILSASAHIRKAADYFITIDLKPGLDEEKLDARILRDFQKYINRTIQNALGDLLLHSLIIPILRETDIPPDRPVNSITKEERNRLLHVIKRFPLQVSALRPMEEAVVTAGGVNTEEVNPRTMESKLMKGLYFAGEVLDLDAYTGGYNLQIAWSTGRLAGLSIVKEVKEYE